jgi:hypothetical protein
MQLVNNVLGDSRPDDYTFMDKCTRNCCLLRAHILDVLQVNDVWMLFFHHRQSFP